MRSSHGLRGNSICLALTDVYDMGAHQNARTRNGSIVGGRFFTVIVRAMRMGADPGWPVPVAATGS